MFYAGCAAATNAIPWLFVGEWAEAGNGRSGDH